MKRMLRVLACLARRGLIPDTGTARVMRVQDMAGRRPFVAWSAHVIPEVEPWRG